MSDYSGALSSGEQKKKIWLADLLFAGSEAEILSNLTRQELRQKTIDLLIDATDKCQRVLFGFDHQYAWPTVMLHLCGLDGSPWREALRSLRNGTYGGPRLDHPSVFCSAFNQWAQDNSVHQSGPFMSNQGLYGLPRSSDFFGGMQPYRVTEQYLTQVGYKPKSCVAIGDNGAVAGQTICGMLELARLLDDLDEQGMQVAFWPFDGLSIEDPAYEGKHVCVEIFPNDNDSVWGLSK
jgi:hypothetical protein